MPGSGSRRPKVTARLLMQPRCEQGRQHLCASSPFPIPPKHQPPKRASQCQGAAGAPEHESVCSYTCVRAPRGRSELGEADFPPASIHWQSGSWILHPSSFSIPSPPPSLQEKGRSEVFLLLFLSMAAEFPREHRHVGGAEGGLTLVFGSCHFQVCRTLGFAVHPPPACAQDGPAGSLLTLFPKSLPHGSARKGRTLLGIPTVLGGPPTPNREWGELDPGIRPSSPLPGE